LEAISNQIVYWKVEHGASPQEGLNGGLVVGEGPDVLLAHMTRKLPKIHVAGLPRDGGRDDEAGVVGADGACRELLHVDGEVHEDLVELVSTSVRGVAFRDGGLEASEKELLLHRGSLLVEVPSDEDLAAGELGQDVVNRDEQALDGLVGALRILRSQVDAQKMDGLSVVQHRSPCDGRPEGLDRFGSEETGCHQCPTFPLHPRLRGVPVLEDDRSREVCLREHRDVKIKVVAADDLLFEVLHLFLAVEAPHVREEDAKLERGRSLMMLELLIRLLIEDLLRVMSKSLGGPLGVPHVLARLLNS
jgi:hypothetical protein